MRTYEGTKGPRALCTHTRTYAHADDDEKGEAGREGRTGQGCCTVHRVHGGRDEGTKQTKTQGRVRKGRGKTQESTRAGGEERGSPRKDSRMLIRHGVYLVHAMHTQEGV